MIWNIARKEIVSNLLSYKFFIVIILTVVLVFTSFFIMHKDNRRRKEADVGQTEIVNRGPGQGFQMILEIIGKITHQTGGDRQGRRRMSDAAGVQYLIEHNKGVRLQ